MAAPYNYSPYPLPFESPLHVPATGESPFYVPFLESPLHLPYESPMHVASALGESATSSTFPLSGATKETRDDEAPVMNKSDEDESDDAGSEYDTDDMDDTECKRRRKEIVSEMDSISNQFASFKDRFFADKLARLDAQIAQLKSGKSEEYLKLVAEETSKMTSKLEASKILTFHKIEAINVALDAEKTFVNQVLRRCEQDLYEYHETLMTDKLQQINEQLENSGNENIESRTYVKGPHVIYELEPSTLDEDLELLKSTTPSISRNQLVLQNRAGPAGRSRNDSEGCLVFNDTPLNKNQRICIEHSNKRGKFIGYPVKVEANKLHVKSDSSNSYRTVSTEQIRRGEVNLTVT